MTAPQELRTARLLLRSFGRRDIPAIVRLAGAREVAAMVTRIPHPYTEADAVSFLDQMDGDCRAGLSAVFAVAILESGELCGAVGLTISPEHQRAELGYWIGVPYWGQGYATEAASAVVAYGFGTLGLRRIFAFHFAENSASRRVLEKVGMRHEGCSRAHVVKWDQVMDLENYGLLASEYRAPK
jgi:ribosomal-protein-alanine N-acetyltransferase